MLLQKCNSKLQLKQKVDSNSSMVNELSMNGTRISTMSTSILTHRLSLSQKSEIKWSSSSNLVRNCLNSTLKLRPTSWLSVSRVTRLSYVSNLEVMWSQQRVFGWLKMTNCTFSCAKWGKQRRGLAPARGTRPWTRSLRPKFRRTSCWRDSRRRTRASISVRPRWTDKFQMRANSWEALVTNDFA